MKCKGKKTLLTTMVIYIAKKTFKTSQLGAKYEWHLVVERFAIKNFTFFFTPTIFFFAG
jgi:hypothetical protein